MKEKASGAPACAATRRNRTAVQTARFSYAGVAQDAHAAMTRF
jgi:hypothetical protein